MNDTKIISDYIAIWGWQIISTIFLVTSLILISLPRNNISAVFYVASFLLFIFCEFKVFTRRRKFNNEY